MRLNYIIKTSWCKKMFVSQIADLKIRFMNNYSTLYIRNTDFLTDSKDFDLTISVSEDEIESEISSSETVIYRGLAEFMCAHRQLCNNLAQFNAFLFHSVLFKIHGKGIALAAHSGIGKTTHLMLWKQLFNDQLVIVNGDKPIIRFMDDSFIGYGTPWLGKEHYGSNTKTEITDICFIQRSNNNYVEVMDKSECIDLIMNQVFIPVEPDYAKKTLHLVDLILEKCNLWCIHCNTDIDAAATAYKAIFGV